MKYQQFKNVWEALEDDPAVVASLTARSELMIVIGQTVKGWKVTHATAAKRLDLSKPRLTDLLRGRIDNFSLDALMNIAVKAGLTVKVKVVKPVA